MLGNSIPSTTIPHPDGWRIDVYDGRDQPFTARDDHGDVYKFCAYRDDAEKWVKKAVLRRR